MNLNNISSINFKRNRLFPIDWLSTRSSTVSEKRFIATISCVFSHIYFILKNPSKILTPHSQSTVSLTLSPYFLSLLKSVLFAMANVQSRLSFFATLSVNCQPSQKLGTQKPTYTCPLSQPVTIGADLWIHDKEKTHLQKSDHPFIALRIVPFTLLLRWQTLCPVGQ